MKRLLACAVLVMACLNPCHARTGKLSDWSLYPIKEPPTMPDKKELSEDEIKLYVAEVNAYAFYIYTYAKIANLAAHEHNITPPLVAPLCQRFPELRFNPIPDRIYIDETAKTPADICRSVSHQLHKILKNYRGDRDRFRAALERHKQSCLYQ